MFILSSSVHLMVLPPFLGTFPPHSHAIEPTLSESVFSFKKWWVVISFNKQCWKSFYQWASNHPPYSKLVYLMKKITLHKYFRTVLLSVPPISFTTTCIIVTGHLFGEGQDLQPRFEVLWDWSAERAPSLPRADSPGQHDDSVGGDLKKNISPLALSVSSSSLPVRQLLCNFHFIQLHDHGNKWWRSHIFHHVWKIVCSHSSSSHLRAEILEIFSSKAVVTPSCPLLSLCSSDHHLVLSDLLTNLIIWSTFFWIELISLLCVSLVLFTMFLKLSRSLFRRSFFTCIARLMSFSSGETFLVLRIYKQVFFGIQSSIKCGYLILLSILIF